jgi:hypothetical protein
MATAYSEGPVQVHATAIAIKGSEAKLTAIHCAIENHCRKTVGLRD